MNRRQLAGASTAALLAGLVKAKAADPTRLPTPADYAALDFVPIPGLEDALGTHREWTGQRTHHYALTRLAAAILAKAPDELAADVMATPDEHGQFLVGLLDLSNVLEAETQMLRAAQVRIAAATYRAGLA